MRALPRQAGSAPLIAPRRSAPLAASVAFASAGGSSSANFSFFTACSSTGTASSDGRSAIRPSANEGLPLVLVEAGRRRDRLA